MNIVFLCVANSARSQMAEGLARSFFKNRFDISVYSAGSKPTSIHPMAIQVMKERGIDVSKHSSKSIDDLKEISFDLVITLCKEEQCPVLPKHVKAMQWPMPDPVGADQNQEQELESFRRICDRIHDKIETLFKPIE